MYRVYINDELFGTFEAHHVDDLIEDLELQGFDINDVTWDDQAQKVYLSE